MTPATGLAWIEAKLSSRSYTPATAPADVETDPEWIEAWAAELIQATIERDGPPVVGHALNERTMLLGMALGDGPKHGVAISEETACAVVAGYWSNEARIGDTIRNAYRSRQNALGCGPVDDPVRKFGAAEKWRQPPKIRKVKNGSKVMMKPVEWIWPGWLARGKYHALGGKAGTGKSTLCFTLLAAITVGGKFPDGSQAPLGDVLIWSGEDDESDTIMPRILAAGGDPKRVWFPDREPGERPFDPSTDFPGILEACCGIPNLEVVMIDPVVSVVSVAKGSDSHKNAETRRDLQPLVDFAKETGAAVLGVTHFTKGTQGRDPLERITGSLAFGALARVVWGTAKSDDNGPRRLVRVKSNIGPDGGGFEYTLERVPVQGVKEAQLAVWGEVIDGSAGELIGAIEGSVALGRSASAFLEQVLGDAGSAGVLVKELKAAAEAHSLSWPTVERAKAKMPHIQAVKNLGDRAPWSWVLLPVTA